MKHALVFGGLLSCWVLLLLGGGGDTPGAAAGAGDSGGAPPLAPLSATPPERAVQGAPSAAPAPNVVDYTMTARLDAKRHHVTGTLSLGWVNPSGMPAAMLPFHLYLNAFSHQGTRLMDVAWRHGVREVRLGSGWGGITVRDVKVDGVPVREAVLMDDGTVLWVYPRRPIGGHQYVRVTLRFEARLPKMRIRTGYAGDFHLVAQWFPKLGRRDVNGSWYCEPFHLNGEFFADFGSYDVTLEVPSGFDVEATGVRTSASSLKGGGKRFRYEAAPVHDFAWVAAPGLKWRRGRLGDVTLQVVHRGEPEAVVGRHLAHMRGALDRLQRWLAPYPYPVLTAVLVPPEAMAAGGMEYPTFFTSSASHAPFLERFGALGTTVHELTHQYFQGLLGSNEVEEPWLDEGFTTYVTGLVMDELHGADRSALEVGPFRLGYFALNRLWYRMLPGQDPANRSAPDFSSPRSYFTNAYGKASLALRTLEGRIGRPRMLGLLRDYVTQYRFRHPRGGDFFRVMDAHVPEPALRHFFRQAIATDGVLDYAVDEVQVRPLARLAGRFEHTAARARRDARAKLIAQGHRHLCRVLLVRRGALRLPVPVVLHFADGSRQERIWDGEDRWHWIEVSHRHPLVWAEIDPGRTLALERTVLDNGRLVKPDARPARRVAGRLLVGLQVALQAVGL